MCIFGVFLEIPPLGKPDILYGWPLAKYMSETTAIVPGILVFAGDCWFFAEDCQCFSFTLNSEYYPCLRETDSFWAKDYQCLPETVSVRVRVRVLFFVAQSAILQLE